MNRRLQYALAIASVASALLPQAVQGALIGQWDFNSGTLAGTVGAAITYADGPGATTQAGTSFGTSTALGVPDIGGTAVNIMKFPAAVAPAGYAVPINVAGNGGGSLVNQWTLIVDILFPAESNNKWRSFIETDNGAIEADAEFFVNTANGIGVSGNYTGTVLPNTWHRIAFTVDQSDGVNQIRKYIDGVEVGVQNAGGLDGRWALSPGGTATLFSDNDGDVSPGFVNSVQIYDVALPKAQIGALGAPSASGLPTTLPPIPAYLDSWIPKTAFAKTGTEVGVILNKGSVNVTGITAKYDGANVTPTVTTAGDLITVKVPGAATPLRSDHTLIVNYTDSAVGARSLTNSFRIPLNFEDFDSVVLGPNVDEGVAGEQVFSKDGPAGWTVDNSQMPKIEGVGSWEDPGIGVTEFKGWTFLDRNWWVQTAGDQDRSLFTLASGVVAVADPDEWDDIGNPDGTIGYFTSFFSSPNIPVSGLSANSITLKFASSWRPEGKDDTGPDGQQTNDQTAVVRVSFDGGAAVEVLRWNSVDGSPTFKPDSQNEQVTIAINNPAGASNMKVTFGLLNAGNDWWWAVDNFVVDSGSLPPPVITGEPANATSVQGQSATFTGAASGAAIGYQWFFGDAPIAGATSASLTLANLALSQAGGYKLVASNTGGAVTSRVATLAILPALTDNSSLRTGLRSYLPFDGNYTDASGNNINATPVGSPTFVAGAVGSGAMLATTKSADTVFNYATLGDQLNFGSTEDFAVSFWAKVTSVSGDPGLIGNKDWDSGGNAGFVIFTTSGRRARWNYRNAPANRVDSANVPPEAFPADQWGHVIVSFDRGGNATTYVNGNLIDTRPLGDNGDTFLAEGMQLNIGQDGAGDYSSDQVAAYDEVAFWNRVITQQEAALIYQSGAAGRSFLVAPPSAITAAASLVDGDVKLSWTGGTAPFLIQGATTLGGAWTDIVTTSANEVTIPAVGPAAFLRIQDGTTKSIRLFKANITPAQEVASPAVVSPASGKGFFSISGLNAAYYISFDGTVANVTASHLHNAAAGVNGGVLFHLAPSPNFPAGTRGGILTGTQVLTAAQLTEIENGRTYVNIHSATYTAGELRGQLLP